MATKKSRHDPAMIESVNRVIPLFRRIVDELLWISDEDLDEDTAVIRNEIQRHPLFTRLDEQPKNAIINVLIKFVPEDDNLTGMQIQKYIDKLNKYSGVAGLRREMERIVADESTHMELRALIDTLLIKYSKVLKKE